MSNISIFDLHNDISISTKDSSWQVSEKKGMLSGISASVTGIGHLLDYKEPQILLYKS